MSRQIVFNGINDLDLTHIFECGQCFRWNPEDDSYVGVVGGHVAKATELRNGNSPEGATLVLDVTGGDEAFWRNYFDLDTDYGDIKRKIIEKEPKIADACEYGCGIRILNQDMFETLISFIISQNNNIPRIKKCIEAICERYGEPLGEVFGKERYAFPSAEVLAAAPVCELAELKLGYRCEYIVASAMKYVKEGAPSTYEEVISYHGIGPKVADCVMLFGVHRVDAFPIDTWVKHIMNDMYGFDRSDTGGMAKFAEERFGSLAGYAQQYLFYYYRDRK